jgi:hypothetical protein
MEHYNNNNYFVGWLFQRSNVTSFGTSDRGLSRGSNKSLSRRVRCWCGTHLASYPKSTEGFIQAIKLTTHYHLRDISGSHGGEYEDGWLLSSGLLLSDISLPTFQRCLPPTLRIRKSSLSFSLNAYFTSCLRLRTLHLLLRLAPLLNSENETNKISRRPPTLLVSLITCELIRDDELCSGDNFITTVDCRTFHQGNINHVRQIFINIVIYQFIRELLRQRTGIYVSCVQISSKSCTIERRVKFLTGRVKYYHRTYFEEFCCRMWHKQTTLVNFPFYNKNVT